MISQIRGEVIEKTLDRVVVDVQGVGYEVLLSELDLEEIQNGQSAQFHTYFHVRENSQELFGFLQSGGKQLFQQLISVNGVGPKGGMAIMALGSGDDIRNAIAASNIAFLTGASGIGKKAAEKIIIDLKDKVGLVATGDILSSLRKSKGDEAHEALVALGYSAQQANEALSQIDPSLKIEDRIKQALKGLSR